jgi:hypothetical protein
MNLRPEDEYGIEGHPTLTLNQWGPLGRRLWPHEEKCYAYAGIILAVAYDETYYGGAKLDAFDSFSLLLIRELELEGYLNVNSDSRVRLRGGVDCFEANAEEIRNRRNRELRESLADGI